MKKILFIIILLLLTILIPFKVKALEISCTRNMMPDTVDFWELGLFNTNIGKPIKGTVTYTGYIRLTGFIEVDPNTAYYISMFKNTPESFRFVVWGIDDDLIIREMIYPGDGVPVQVGYTFTTGSTTTQLAVVIYYPGNLDMPTQDILDYIISGKLKPFLTLDSNSDKTFVPYVPCVPIPPDPPNPPDPPSPPDKMSVQLPFIFMKFKYVSNYLNKFGFDISAYSEYEQCTIFLIFSVLVVIVVTSFINVIYRLVLMMKRLIFG